MSKFVSAFDSYNLCLTGDIGRTLATPSGGLNEHIPTLLILNDQGGGVMSVSTDVASTLRAQMKHHEPIVCFHKNSVVCLNFQGSKSNNVFTEDGTCYSLNAMHGHDVHVICFEPGIVRREGSDSRFVKNKSVTLRAQMGDNQPAVCFQQNQREEVRDMGDCAGALTAESGMHNTNFICHEVKDE